MTKRDNLKLQAPKVPLNSSIYIIFIRVHNIPYEAALGFRSHRQEEYLKSVMGTKAGTIEKFEKGTKSVEWCLGRDSNSYGLATEGF